ncbi:MAG: SDR family NAD(P)-dependent oxidoreductase [Patulibacter sp.]
MHAPDSAAPSAAPTTDAPPTVDAPSVAATPDPDAVGLGIDPADLDIAVRVLAAVDELPLDHPDALAVQRATSRLYKTVKQRRKNEKRQAILDHDAAVTAKTATGAPGRIDDETQGLPLVSSARGAIAGVLQQDRACYVCKQAFRQVDAFYHQLCPSCAELNHARRDARTDLAGRRALLTGGRAKIGMYIALRLLRDGAHLTITTRFPNDAARRFSAMPDSADWIDRLRIVGIDLRDPAQVIALADSVAAAGPLDILVNNAAQTVRRSPQAYALLADAEAAPFEALPGRGTPEFVVLGRPDAGSGAVAGGGSLGGDGASVGGMSVGAGTSLPAAALDHPANADRSTLGTQGMSNVDRSALAHAAAVVPGGHWAPTPHALSALALQANSASPDRVAMGTAIDAGGLVPDLHHTNSWVQTVDEVDATELLEVQLCNQTAPFILIGRLRPALRASSARRTYVVNVSAMEGQFGRGYKGPGHPHTNMSKAALNMLTRTSAQEMLESDGILMTAVDTGWITDERPHPQKMRLADDGFHAPLDLVDGAARVYDPIVRGELGEDLHGVFLKDYAPYPW